MENYCDCHPDAKHTFSRNPRKDIGNDVCLYFQCKNCKKNLSANLWISNEIKKDRFTTCGECRKNGFLKSSASRYSFNNYFQMRSEKTKQLSFSKSWSGFSNVLNKTYDDVKDEWEGLLKKAEAKAEEKTRNRSSFSMEGMKRSFGQSLEDIFT